jgi:hypothetical protein
MAELGFKIKDIFDFIEDPMILRDKFNHQKHITYEDICSGNHYYVINAISFL